MSLKEFFAVARFHGFRTTTGGVYARDTKIPYARRDNGKIDLRATLDAALGIGGEE